MKPFIFDARNGIHIIVLSKTLHQFEAAMNFLSASVCKGLKVLLVAIVDTKCVPDLVYKPSAWNDDAIRSVRMILTTLGATVAHAQAEYEARYARRKAAQEPEPEQTAATTPAALVAGIEMQ